jgi:hypothetical protein
VFITLLSYGFCWTLDRVYAINVKYRNISSQWQKSNISHLCACILTTRDYYLIHKESESSCHYETSFYNQISNMENSDRKLNNEIANRKQAEQKIQHLNSLLRATRNVSQLIAREKDRAHLIQGACECLSEIRGYHSIWGPGSR